MVDVLMIVFIVVFGLLLIASNVYILYHFCAEDDTKQCSNYLAKGIAVNIFNALFKFNKELKFL